MITKAEYFERRHAALDRLDIEIQRLTDYADCAGSEVAEEYYEVIRNLQGSRENAAEMLSRLQETSEYEADWSDALADVERAWAEMRESVLMAISTTYNEKVEA